MTIHVVECWYQNSDHGFIHWMVRGFTDLNKAQEWAAKAKVRTDELMEKYGGDTYHDFPEGRCTENEFDPGLQVAPGSRPPKYFVAKLEVEG